MNLLSNAIKYSDSRKPKRWVRVSGEMAGFGADGFEVVVRVEDNGIGIPPGVAEKVFERFFRAHSDSEPSIEGSGLGLSLVRDTIEAIGGRVWLEAEEGRTTFLLALPCRRAADMLPVEGRQSHEHLGR